jgi:hypothetical protein
MVSSAALDNLRVHHAGQKPARSLATAIQAHNAAASAFGQIGRASLLCLIPAQFQSPRWVFWPPDIFDVHHSTAAVLDKTRVHHAGQKS